MGRQAFQVGGRLFRGALVVAPWSHPFISRRGAGDRLWTILP